MRIEDGTIDDRLVDEVRGYCAPLRDAGVDTVILGCTHYPLVRPIIQRMLGPDASIVTSGAPLARQVEHVLGVRGLDSPREGEGTYGFLCTGEQTTFHANGTRFLQLPLGEVGKVRLGAAAARVGAA
jgi:glutamate racemase